MKSALCRNELLKDFLLIEISLQIARFSNESKFLKQPTENSKWKDYYLVYTSDIFLFENFVWKILILFCGAGQQLVQLPGGKLHVLHTQQSGGVTSTSLAGNAILKKMAVTSEGQQVEQQFAVAKSIEEVSSTSTIDVNTQQVKQIAVLPQGMKSALKQFLPVTKIQMGTMAGGKPAQVKRRKFWIVKNLSNVDS